MRGALHRLRLVSPAAIALLLAGCASAPRVPPAPLVQSSTFQIFQGDSLVATEQVVRFNDRMEGSVELVGRARAEYVAYMDGGGPIWRFDAQVRPWEGTSIGYDLSAQFVGDSILIERTEPIRSSERRAGGPVMPYLHPSPALIEQLVRRAINSGENPFEVRVWFPTRGVTPLARVTRVTSRIMDVMIAGGQMRVWLDDFGMVLAEVPSLGWLIQRR
jgi:hypothetical protein